MACAFRLAHFAFGLFGKGAKTQVISREVNLIRPFQPEPIIGDAHALHEISRLPHRLKHAAFCNRWRQSTTAVTLSDRVTVTV